ncbi:MAG TPA: polynucleotide adenylyltransferase, partial [Dehalococcoidia bacterium]|nr:polynucleotide adenylyltransferase [Dehalococcoidia bacterium]
DTSIAILVLSLADHMAARGPRIEGRDFMSHVAYIAYVVDRWRWNRVGITRHRLLTGHDIMEEFRLPPGPLVGRVLRAVDEAQGLGLARTRDEAVHVAREALATCR